MRALLVVLVLLSALPAASQPLTDLPPPPRLDGGQKAVVTAAGVLGGLAASTAVFLVNNADGSSGSPPEVAFVIAAYPIGLALGSRFAAARYGAGAPWSATAVDAALGVLAGGLAGALAGGAAGGTVYAVQAVTGGVPEYSFGPAIAAVAVGVPVALWVSSRVAGRSLQIAPAMGAAPTGERVVGLSLRVGL